MSDYKPITGELRDAMCQWGWDAEQTLAISGSDFDRLCDSIDAIHAQLEKENAALKAELDRVLGEQEEHAHTRGESITDELREYAEDWDWLDTGAERAQDRIEAIADRIDAEHERVCYDYQREFEDWKFVHNTDFVELPKDADGVSIHIGDKVTHCGRRVYEVNAISFFKDNVSVSFNGESGCGCDSGKNFHHHRAPTVEDVLREFALKVAGEECMTMRTGVVEEFAAKLREVLGE